MSEREYEVSFRATLDERGCVELAEQLFELGYDNSCFRPIPTWTASAVTKRCKDCGETYINWGAHAERCYGPPVGVRGRDGEKEDL